MHNRSVILKSSNTILELYIESIPKMQISVFFCVDYLNEQRCIVS